jgi:hemerythrin
MAEQEKFMKWDNKYLVNVPELDEAHLNLFNLINELYSLNQSKALNQRKLMRSFHDLLEYTYSHFAEEEQYMEKTNYIGVDEHRKLHENIRNQFEDYFTNFKSGTIDMAKFLEFVKTWLEGHIISEDQKYIN